MEPEKKSNGATVGIIVVILILIIGGYYLYKSSMDKSANTNQPAMENSGTSNTSSTSTSADISAAEQGLNSTDVNNLDQGIY